MARIKYPNSLVNLIVMGSEYLKPFFIKKISGISIMQEDLGELRFYFILRTVQEALSALCTFPSFLSSFYKYLKRVFSMLGL